MQNSLNQIKPKKIAAIALAIALAGLAYYQYQAYDTERKLDIERKEISQRLREQGRMLAEEARKHPIKIQHDPLTQDGNPFGTPPSDAEEMAQIKLWHQSPPEQRKKLMPSTDKATNPIPSQESISDSTQKSDEEDVTSTIDQQTLLTVQMQALAAKSKKNSTSNK